MMLIHSTFHKQLEVAWKLLRKLCIIHFSCRCWCKFFFPAPPHLKHLVIDPQIIIMQHVLHEYVSHLFLFMARCLIVCFFFFRISLKKVKGGSFLSSTFTRCVYFLLLAIWGFLMRTKSYFFAVQWHASKLAFKIFYCSSRGLERLKMQYWHNYGTWLMNWLFF